MVIVFKEVIVLSDEEKQVLQNMKDSALLVYDTMDVILSAIEGDTLTMTSLIGPIELIKKGLMNSIVITIDKILEI